MFARTMNPHYSHQVGRVNDSTLGKIGVVPTLKPIGYPNPNAVKKEVASIQRVKR